MSATTRLFESFASFGDLPEDSEETRLHKRFLIYMGTLMSGGGILWGTIAAVFGLYWQSSIPYGYTLMTIVNMTYFSFRKNFAVVRFFQVLISLLLPFLFQWSLGGFAVTGAMMLWALLALVGSLTFQSQRLAAQWLVAYIALTLVSGFIDPFVRKNFSIGVSADVASAFFVVNIIVISGIVVGLMLYFVWSRDRANRELQAFTAQLEEIVDARTRELTESLARMGAIIDNLADGLLVTDEQGKITHVNPALMNMYRIPDEGRYLGRSCADLDPEIGALLTPALKEIKTAVKEIVIPGSRTGMAVATCILHENEDGQEPDCIGSVTLIRDITREKEIDGMKTDFVSNVSHELRTPLTSMLGFAKMIDKKFHEVLEPRIDQETPKAARAVRQIKENTGIIIAEGERLTALINSLLDISKMEAGKTEWQMEAMRLGEVVDHACSATIALFRNKPVQLRKKVAADAPPVMADRNRLIQVVINLISNAVKFTDEGRVDVRCEPRDGGVQVSVTDTGMGIRKEDQSKVFDKFQQVGDTLTDKPQGTGLGLPICKEIVERHGGWIQVESVPGRGSRFSFWLPGSGSEEVADSVARSPARVAARKLRVQMLVNSRLEKGYES